MTTWAARDRLPWRTYLASIGIDGPTPAWKPRGYGWRRWNHLLGGGRDWEARVGLGILGAIEPIGQHLKPRANGGVEGGTRSEREVESVDRTRHAHAAVDEVGRSNKWDSRLMAWMQAVRPVALRSADKKKVRKGEAGWPDVVMQVSA